MNSRIAIFAHYDKEDVIDDYVLFYVKELQKIVRQVIFVSCCDLSQHELDKLDCIKIAQKHDEYDFGSYKIGFNYAKKNKLLDDCEELIFANDSCYGPFKPLDKIFDVMQQAKCDFWGLTKNKYGFKLKKGRPKDTYVPHIQTYFFVLRPSVFNSSVFADFINSVKKEDAKNNIIANYEIGLTQCLENAGFNSEYYIKNFYKYNNPTIFKWRKLYEKSNFPFVKCSLLRLQNKYHTTVDGWQKLFTSEQINLIEKNLQYTKRIKPMQHLAPQKLKEFVFDIIPKGSSRRASIVRFLLKTVGFWLID